MADREMSVYDSYLHVSVRGVPLQNYAAQGYVDIDGVLLYRSCILAAFSCTGAIFSCTGIIFCGAGAVFRCTGKIL